MQTVGYIDIKKYRCIAENITTNEVILTQERIQHIKERHPGHFERIEPYLREALKEPDYILKDERVNTGLILKWIEQENLRFQVVLKIHTSTDDSQFKHSILSGWVIREKEYRRLIRKKETLYKRE